MCWTGTFSSSPETCLPINCSVRACQWVSGCVCARVRACILFVCVCLVFVMCRTRAFICALGARMHVVTWVCIQSFCLCVEVSSQTRGRAPSQMCPFLYLRCACAFSTRGVCVCVCVRLISHTREKQPSPFNYTAVPAFVNAPPRMHVDKCNTRPFTRRRVSAWT